MAHKPNQILSLFESIKFYWNINMPTYLDVVYGYIFTVMTEPSSCG